MPHHKRIGLFGGTFDPVHLGHIQVAEWVRSNLKLDQIFFIPIYIHPFQKRQDITNADARLKMLELAIKEYPEFSLCDYEIKKKGVSYSIDTIRYFKKIYTKSTLFYLIGSDNLQDFFQWKDPESIFNLATVIVYDRVDSAVSKSINIDPRFQFVQCPLIEISSSLIREKIKKKQLFRFLLHPDVHDYIVSQKLYLT